MFFKILPAHLSTFKLSPFRERLPDQKAWRVPRLRMPQNSWGCPWLYMFGCLPAPQPGGKAGPRRTWHAHPPPEPVPLLPDGVHGGLGPVQLLLFAAQHGGEALILFPQPGQLLLPTRPFFSQVGIQVPAKYPLNLLDCLENTKTSPVGSLRERGGKGWQRVWTEWVLPPFHCQQ